jgi:conjugal transfer pilus assembly protein TraU
VIARVRRYLMAIAAAIGLAAATPAAAVPGVCSGHFVNPITDVCWTCLFPLSVGALPIWPGGGVDTDNPVLPICLCGTPVPRIGIAVGFWEPVRLADVTMKPWCFVNLGGISLDPGLDIGMKYFGNGGRGPGGSGGWQVHWYAYPLLYWLEILSDFLCLEKASVDILYITEIDPLWQDSELSLIINPEAVVFNNPLAVAACAADCVAATAHLPDDPIFWCAGCQGTMYPLDGNLSAQYGHVQGSRLAVERFIFKLHRELIEWGTSGQAGLCGKYIMPIIKKSQYRIQATNPVPSVVGPWSCPPIGSVTVIGSGQMIPVIGEDMGYLIWRKRNCCVL